MATKKYTVVNGKMVLEKKPKGRTKKVIEAVTEKLETKLEPVLEEKFDDIVKDVETLKNEIKEEELKLEKSRSIFKWDVPKESDIDYFDANLSYEATGYKPIDGTRSLDFNPNWFIETRKTYEETGKYCAYLPGSKKFREFWKEQYKRCRDGFTVNSYTITGDHYFFLNFYTLPLVHKVKVAGQGRPEGFPNFTVALYIWFHYYRLCEIKKKNAILMKARGVG